jgi:CBS domain-containing protein
MKSVKNSSTLRARDVMTPDPVCVRPETTIRELARVLESNEISGVPVVDETGALIGIVSKTDLIRRCSEGSPGLPPACLVEALFERAGDDESVDAVPEPLICVQDIMTEHPLVVSLETPVATVAQRMFEGRIHRVIVVDGSRVPIGIISSLDLLGVFPR